MALLDVLLPEMLFLEELGAIRDPAAPFVLILLLDMLQQLLIEDIVDGFSAELAEINRLGLENLHDLVFECLDPVVGSLELLLGFGRGTELAVAFRSFPLFIILKAGCSFFYSKNWLLSSEL